MQPVLWPIKDHVANTLRPLGHFQRSLNNYIRKLYFSTTDLMQINLTSVLNDDRVVKFPFIVFWKPMKKGRNMLGIRLFVN
jgi:hypothetical protein